MIFRQLRLLLTSSLYIIDSLNDDGFLTRYTHPNLLFISWRHCIPHYVRDEYKKKTGISIDKFGNEIKKKEDNKLQLINTEKKVSNKKDSSFKPSGKFIYDSSVLNKIKEIL